ncbi:hypothetical protein T265_02661 [Opisthorchis viverrini]|uniref:Uncharacterized protein n=1 Tax=Opisthorchis viverrini TaxID=6198 RepID=A0A075A5S3_OPIVI|nr:hypothetical protein T265_02661 [Opisthorchis viverrini]KER30980.1 hypothetical protein T265_02661 [Opisthorchis viverrini]
MAQKSAAVQRECEFNDRKDRGSNPSASRLLLSRLWQPGSTPALVPSSGGMAARHRRAVTAKPFCLALRNLSVINVFSFFRWCDSPYLHARLPNKSRSKHLTDVMTSRHTVTSHHTNKVKLEVGARWLKWLEREVTDREVCWFESDLCLSTSLSRLGQPSSIPAPVLGMAVRHRNGVTAAGCTALKH